MPEKGLGAGAAAIGAGEEQRDQIPDKGSRKRDLVGQPVERGAQAADNRHGFQARAVPACVGDRIVAPDDGAEIARGRQLVVKAAVGDEEGLAAGLLAIDDAAQVDAAVGDQPAPELEREARPGERRVGRLARMSARPAPSRSRSSARSPGK